MNQTLTASDGHSFNAYIAQPPGDPKGLIILIQEIFGVNSHIRSVADGYAQAGYLVVAPALFDRVQRNYEAGYSQDEVGKGVEIMKQLSFENALLDVQAAAASAPKKLKSAIVGYCYGGTVAWLVACKLHGLSAAVCYYGGGIPGFSTEKPRCPTMLHFGTKDQSLPVEKARSVADEHPEVVAYFYDAGHGFNCDQRGSYDESSASLARERTLAFLQEKFDR